MTVYCYNGQTGRFVGVETADIDPLDAENWLIPANATTVKPPSAANGGFWPFWTGTEWELRDEGTAKKELHMRQMRDAALAASDWTQLSDSPLSRAERDAWKKYRQALRDLTKKPGWPFVTMPEKK